MFFRFSKLPNRWPFYIARAPSYFHCKFTEGSSDVQMYITVHVCSHKTESFFYCVQHCFLSCEDTKILYWMKQICMSNWKGACECSWWDLGVVTPPYFTSVKTCQCSECGQTTKDEAPTGRLLVNSSQLSENTCGNDIKRSSVLLANYWSLFVQTVRGLKYPEECAP